MARLFDGDIWRWIRHPHRLGGGRRARCRHSADLLHGDTPQRYRELRAWLTPH